ncbi:hypothetical protein [Serratia sp. 2723]|uniref:hypothetical protein n=1 Tax=unclassified Serratia (in: enterobacteria) TaxID=2647522 RepID=UPI003D227679
MNKQNVKMTLLASLVTGLVLSQGAMAAGGALVTFETKVGTTTCNVGVGTGTQTDEAATKVFMGEFTPTALTTIGTTGTKTKVGNTNYGLTTGPEGGAGVVLNVTGCEGASLAKGSGINMLVEGPSAMGVGKNDLYGDYTTDQGFGIALEYTVHPAKDFEPVKLAGYATPTDNTIEVINNTKDASGVDAAALPDASVSIMPHVAVYGQNDAAFTAGATVDTVVHFTVVNN